MEASVHPQARDLPSRIGWACIDNMHVDQQHWLPFIQINIWYELLILKILNSQIKIENHILSNNPITSEILDEILDNLDKSMQNKLFEYKDRINDWEGMKKTLEGEHGIRLETLLQQKGSRFILLDENQLKIVEERKKDLFINLENAYKEV